MSDRTITLTLPEALYERIRVTAEASARSVEDVATQSLALSLPPLEESLPVRLQSELAAFSLLSDAELHTIATETMEEDSQVQLEEVAEAQKVRSLTAAEQAALNHLMEEANRVMIRKAEAYRLLAQRSHAIFPAQEFE